MQPETATHPHPREAIAQRNLAQILDAAERLMARGEQVSIAAVAAEAGVSRPTVYAHFADRQQLFEGVVERVVTQVIRAIESAEPQRGPAPDALRRVIETSWTQLSRHEAIAQAAAAQLTAEAMHRSHHAALAMLRQLLERGRADGSFRSDVNPELLVGAALALIHATADASRRGLIGSDAAGAAAERLIVEMWQRR